MDAIRYREAGCGDAGALGTLHVASWRETYVGILPAEMLAGLSADERSSMWGAVLDDPARFGGTSIFLGEHAGTLVGFGTCTAQRDEALSAQGWDGEIGALYVLRSHQGQGIGTALMGFMAVRLLDQGRTKASLWVLRQNRPARRFYERLGGLLIGEKEEAQAGTILTEVAYGWADLSALAAA